MFSVVSYALRERPMLRMARYLKKKFFFLMAVEKMSKKFPKSSSFFSDFFSFFFFLLLTFPSDLLETGRERNVRIAI